MPRSPTDKNRQMAGTERLSVTLQSTMESPNLAGSLIAQFAERYDYTPQQCREIELAVREVVANAVLHGNACDRSKRVFFSAEMHAASLVICIRDQGRGFDPAAVPDPRVAENLLRESGRGLLLVKTYMDEVTWRPATPVGMEIVLTKYRSKRHG